MTLRTFCFVFSLMLGESCKVRETVEVATPAFFATSLMVTAIFPLPFLDCLITLYSNLHLLNCKRILGGITIRFSRFDHNRAEIRMMNSVRQFLGFQCNSPVTAHFFS